MTGDTESGDSKEAGFQWRRLWPLAAILIGIALFFLFDLDRFVTFEHLKAHHRQLAVYVQDHYVSAVLAYVALYVLVVVLSIPAASLLTITGGFLFGAVAATFFTLIGATTGATLLFLAAKTSLGDYLLKHAGPWMSKIEHGFAENRWSYMLMLRLVPAVPFFIANLLPAFLGVSLGCYVVTTFFGIIPGTAVYASIGSGLGGVLESNADFSVKGLLTPHMKLAFTALALLSALPIVVKAWRRRKRAK